MNNTVLLYAQLIYGRLACSNIQEIPWNHIVAKTTLKLTCHCICVQEKLALSTARAMGRAGGHVICSSLDLYVWDDW